MTTEVREATEATPVPTEEQASTEQDLDKELEGFLPEKSTESAESEPGKEAAAPSEQTEDKELDDLIKAEREVAESAAREDERKRVADETEAKRVEDAAIAQRQGIAQAYNYRYADIHNKFAEAGLENTLITVRGRDGREQDVNLRDYVLGHFRYQNGQYADAFIVGLVDAVADELPETERDSFKRKALKGDFQDTRGLTKAFRGVLQPLIESEARKGYVSEKEAEAAEKRGMVKFIRRYETDEGFRQSLETRIKTGHNLGNGSSSRSLTLAQIDAMPMNEWESIPQEQRERLLERAHRDGT